MAKKYRSKKEQEALMLKIFKIGGIVLAILLAVVILMASVLPKLSTSYGFAYFKDPWDGGSPFEAFNTKKELFAYSTAMKAIEAHGMDFSQVSYPYLAVDLSTAEGELKEGLKGYFTYWGEKNGKEVLFATRDELIEQGYMVSNSKYSQTFTDGYILEFTEHLWSEERDQLIIGYLFHHASMDARGYTVTVDLEWNGWKVNEEIATLTA